MSESQNGRPPAVLSPKQIDQVEALAAVCTKTQMAAYFGVTEKTFRAIEQRQSEVFTAYRKGRAMAIASVATSLYDRAMAGNFLPTNAGRMEREEGVRP